MKIKSLCCLLSLVLLLWTACSCRDAVQAANTGSGKTEVTIDINKEDKEVGLRRMEIIDKMLSQDMLDRKMSIVHNIEQDYTSKARDMINSIIPPIFDSKVFTHIEVNFFSPSLNHR